MRVSILREPIQFGAVAARVREMRPRTILQARSALFFAAGIAAGSFVATNARAADPPSDAPALVSTGIERFKQKDYEGARVAFRAAYALDPEVATLNDLALAEIQSGHPVDAIRHFRSLLKTPGVPPEQVEAIQTRWLPRAEAETARLAIEAPSGAALFVDDEPNGVLPQTEPLDVGVGEHDVVVRLGAWSRKSHVTAHAGETVHVILERPAAVAPPPSPSPRRRPERGEAPSSGPSTAKLVTVLSVGGAAVASLVAGVVYDVRWKNDADAASRFRAGLSSSACSGSMPASVCPALHQTIQDWTQDQNLTIGFYVAAGALAAGAVATWLLWPHESDAKSRQAGWRLVPALGARTAGALVEGSF